MGKYVWKEIKLINKSTYFITFLLVNCLLLNLKVSENGYTVKKALMKDVELEWTER